jgi:hypothetical protein
MHLPVGAGAGDAGGVGCAALKGAYYSIAAEEMRNVFPFNPLHLHQHLLQLQALLRQPDR